MRSCLWVGELDENLCVLWGQVVGERTRTRGIMWGPVNVCPVVVGNFSCVSGVFLVGREGKVVVDGCASTAC